MPETWFFLRSGPGEAAWNMALDHALLEAMPQLRAPVLRSYSWAVPAASFGYFQRILDVEELTPLRPLIRRPTGGGIVPHDQDWTYSLLIPAGHEWHGLKAVESYRRVHTWLQAAFAVLGISTDLAPSSSKTGAGRCFAGYERFDLLWRGRKLAGAAQRRTRDGLLVQGSIQPPPPGVVRGGWEQAMQQVSVFPEGVQWRELPSASLPLTRADELSRLRYSQDGYNRKR